MALKPTNKPKKQKHTEQPSSSSGLEMREEESLSVDEQAECRSLGEHEDDCVLKEQGESSSGTSLLMEVLATPPEAQSGLMSRALMVLEHVLLNDSDPTIRNAALEQYSSLITNECNLSLMQSRQGAPAYGQQSPDKEFGYGGARQSHYGQR